MTKKHSSRVTDDELFTRLLYCGLAHLHLTQEDVWLTPFGLLLDLWECHRQYTGAAGSGERGGAKQVRSELLLRPPVVQLLQRFL